MAFLSVNNVKICGIACAVPQQKKIVKDLPFFEGVEADNFSKVTGVVSSHLAPEGMTESDLCQEAAEKLIEASGWEKDSIEMIIFVSTSRDFYISPNTANILQHKLGLQTSCIAFDLPFACSGYIYGLSVASSIMQSGQINRCLLCVGETPSKNQSNLDKTVWALHGDAGSATLLEYDTNVKHPFQFNLNGDGSKWDAIMCKEMGTRYPTTPESFKMKEYEEGVVRNATQCTMDGMAVFSFAISKPARCINDLCTHFNFALTDIDYLLIHQANKMIDDKIRKKLNLSQEQVPYSMMEYGNSSSGTIPITMVTQLNEKLKNEETELVMCGFGSGLSWGAAHIFVDKIICLPVIEKE